MGWREIANDGPIGDIVKAIALAVLAFWIAAGFGRRLTGPIRSLQNAPLERFVYSAALGFGVAAYGVVALGLVGLLRFGPVTLWWLALALLGLPGIRDTTKDALRGLQNLRSGFASGRLSGEQIFCVTAGCVVLCCAFAAILACFVPPNGLDWDAIAYHLADPKVFLQQGRISSLPTEHHSNFPFTMESLYAVGLLYDGYALANLFHFTMAFLTVAAISAFCRRHFSATVGWFAALLFATTPVVLWEASVSYIELGFGLYATLAAFAAIQAIQKTENRKQKTEAASQKPEISPLSSESGSASAPRSSSSQAFLGEGSQGDGGALLPLLPGLGEGGRGDEGHSWLALSGAAMGFALGMKYLALLPFVFVALLLLWRRVPLKRIAIYASVAIVMGSPWYIKNLILTRNPVYPFAYGAFPHSKYWSADRSALYQGDQDHFGEPHSLKNPAVAAQNLLLAPYRLLSESGKYSNPGEYTFMALFGGLYAAFGFALILQRRLPQAIRDLLIFGGLQCLAWFFVAQISRYLVAVLPTLAIVCGYGAWRLTFAKPANRLTQLAVFGAFIGQTVLLLWGILLLPTSARVAYETKSMPTAMSIPEALAIVTTPDGATEHLRRTLDVYDATAWLNQNAPQESGVILYDNVLGFYLDRPYLWGNSQHSSYIPYETLMDGKPLTDWLTAHQIHYALFNLNLAQPQYDPNGAQFPQGPNRNEEAALHQWYDNGAFPAGDWRVPVQDAIRRNLWRVAFAKNGVIVLEF